jgi:signal transduction histidine kinase
VNLRDVTLDRQHRDTLASFAGVVAHDLFNPLTIVDGWTEALAAEFTQGSVTPAVGSLMVSRISSAAAHMRTFIADLLSYTVARDQTLRLGPVDVTALARSLAGLRAETTADPVIAVQDGLEVWADAGLVRQLLDNLIGNALKYVAPGVEPKITVHGCQSLPRLVTIQIADNGIGIPAGEREKIFDEFHRAHYRDYEGSGLGLSIVRRIITRHDGTIMARANPAGQGSVFEFTLPSYTD